MQISRHWRLNAQRYRLEGLQHGQEQTSLQERPVPVQARRDEAATDAHSSSETPVELRQIAS